MSMDVLTSVIWATLAIYWLVSSFRVNDKQSAEYYGNIIMSHLCLILLWVSGT